MLNLLHQPLLENYLVKVNLLLLHHRLQLLL
jgi:hypothetical protein